VFVCTWTGDADRRREADRAPIGGPGRVCSSSLLTISGVRRAKAVLHSRTFAGLFPVSYNHRARPCALHFAIGTARADRPAGMPDRHPGRLIMPGLSILHCHGVLLTLFRTTSPS
jgi:hypothetical protein